MQRLRVGTTGDAAAAAFVDGLELPPWSDRVSLRTYRDDATLAADFDAGRVELALLDAARLLERLDRAELVPGLAATTDGPSGLARIVADVPLGEIDRVAAADPRSAGALLCRALFAASGRSIEVVGVEPGARHGGTGGEARLVESADATTVRVAARTDVDLGAAWTELTGLPFVWRAWCLRPGRLDRATYALLHAARARGVRRAARAGATPVPIVYRLGRREIEAIELLASTAARHGLPGSQGTVRLARLPRGGACADAAARPRDGSSDDRA